MNPADLLTTPELATATGLTKRQLDYWTANRAIEATFDPGRHFRRSYHHNLVKPLRIVAAFHRQVGAGVPVDLVAAIVDNYDAGYVDLADGLRLSWRADRPLETPGQLHARTTWTGPVYLTDAECDRLEAAVGQLPLEEHETRPR